MRDRPLNDIAGQPAGETTGTLHIDLAAARRRLREQRERFVALRGEQREERDQLLDARPLDGGDRAQREDAVDLLDQLDASEFRELQAIDAALARIEAGTYGICMECGEPIEPERLEALPTATRCIHCAEVEVTSDEFARREHRSTTL